MKVDFYKMTGLGNDYVYLDFLEKQYSLNLNKFANQVSNRNFSVGSDGLVVILPSKKADAKMRIFNSDGSEAEICGNALRCVSKLIYDKTGKRKISIETKKKTIHAEILENKGTSAKVRVEMGKVVFLSSQTLNICEKTLNIHLLDAGNPHCVVFVNDFNFNIENLGKQISSSTFFKNGTNVEFVKILDKNSIQMKVYERGSGVTLACGSGACASAVCFENLYKPEKKDIEVFLDGGNLNINCKDSNNTIMTGLAQLIFTGKLYLKKEISHKDKEKHK